MDSTSPNRAAHLHAERAARRYAAYAVGEVLACGATGVIHRARETVTGRQVAMKQMRDLPASANPRLTARFAREAKITAHLEHPNVIPVHEVSMGGDGPGFYTMKMAPGVTLEKIITLLRQEDADAIRKYSLESLLTIFQKVCDALAFAHSKGVIRRALKPANIMVGEYGEVLAMDWGAARLLPETAHVLAAEIPPEKSDTSDIDLSEPEETATLTAPAYLSPEQLGEDPQDADARSDVYALGAILYELLTLQPPAEGRDSTELLENARAGKLIPPLQRVAAKRLPHISGGALPVSLAAVAMKALAFSPERRYQRVADLQADVRAFQAGHATAAEDAGAWRQLTLLVKRHQSVSTAIAASLILLATLSVIFTGGVIRERDRANLERDRAARAFEQVSLERDRAARALALVEPERQRANTERDRAEAEAKATNALKAQLDLEKTRVTDALAKVEPLRQLANAERDRAAQENASAMATLEKLRATAPTFLAQAESLIRKQQFPEAIEKLDFAAAFDPRNPAYLLRAAHLLQATLRLREAAAAYRQVIASGPNSEAAINLTLCEKLLAESADPAQLPKQRVRFLYQSLLSQKRDADGFILARRLDKMIDPAEALILERIKPWESIPGWHKVQNRLKQNPDGTFLLNIGFLPIADITPLTGLPIAYLWMSSTNVADLTPLHGMPLQVLLMERTRVRTLEPLRGMELRIISIQDTQIEDLSPLAGMALESLLIMGTKVRDLSPVRNAHVKVLSLGSPELRDISPLKGMPTWAAQIRGTQISDLSPIDNPDLTILTIGQASICPEIRSFEGLKTAPLSRRLECMGAINLTDIEALRGKPITKADFTNCEKIRDLSPLAACPHLFELRLPGPLKSDSPWAASLPTLRAAPTLQWIAYGNGPLKSPAEFWADYDRAK